MREEMSEMKKEYCNMLAQLKKEYYDMREQLLVEVWAELATHLGQSTNSPQQPSLICISIKGNFDVSLNKLSHYWYKL